MNDTSISISIPIIESFFFPSAGEEWGKGHNGHHSTGSEEINARPTWWSGPVLELEPASLPI
jgi:hypothetical protein